MEIYKAFLKVKKDKLISLIENNFFLKHRFVNLLFVFLVSNQEQIFFEEYYIKILLLTRKNHEY